jgi:methylated-DNA-[protein]-cysteine S-methyltransferase
VLSAEVPEAAAAASRFSRRAVREGRADLCYATVASPVGELLLIANGRGLTMLHYLDGDIDQVLDTMAARRSPRILESASATDRWRRELEEYFNGARQRFDAPLDWRGIDGFRRRVLRAAVAIPYGNAVDYKTIAMAAGSPFGARAAGNALGSNPLPIVIPCHRVLRVGGGLGGYTGGVERKRLLLTLERAT